VFTKQVAYATLQRVQLIPERVVSSIYTNATSGDDNRERSHLALYNTAVETTNREC
jgi:hypothetical protein